MKRVALLAVLGLLCIGFSLPNRSLTPGDVDPALTMKVLCAKGFTTRVYRHTTESLKRRICQEYQAANCPSAAWEIDHLVSLTTGGADVQTNLWPQPIAEARVKDKLEVRLHSLVCKGAMPLIDAQRCLSNDWVACYRKIFGATP